MATALAGTEGKPKDIRLIQEINNSEALIITTRGDGTVNSISGGGRGTMSKEEFTLKDSFLDFADYDGGKVTELLDMQSITVFVVRTTDAAGANPTIKKYVWEGGRLWW